MNWLESRDNMIEKRTAVNRLISKYGVSTKLFCVYFKTLHIRKCSINISR